MPAGLESRANEVKETAEKELARLGIEAQMESGRAQPPRTPCSLGASRWVFRVSWASFAIILY